MAESYAPSMLARIAKFGGDFDQAEALIERSLKMAQANDWSRLAALNQALRGLPAFHHWLEIGNDQLQSAIQSLASSEEGWRLLDEAGEFHAALATATYVQAGTDQAKSVLERASIAVAESWTAHACYWSWRKL
jgi:hypothetical protein